jgi:hypothetical protein
MFSIQGLSPPLSVVHYTFPVGMGFLLVFFLRVPDHLVEMVTGDGYLWCYWLHFIFNSLHMFTNFQELCIIHAGLLGIKSNSLTKTGNGPGHLMGLITFLEW